MKEIGVDESSIFELEQLGIERPDAVACLKACNGNLARAAEYFYNGDLEKAKNDAKWNEDVWSAPREGHGPALPPGHDNNFSQFQIQSSDVLAPNVFEPKSRPPSRISNRIDLTVDENDPELARALAASMQDSGSQSGYGQQETGITGTHTSPTNPNFRDAAPGQEYDPSQWALTTTQTVEIFLDPPPIDRKRQLGGPAFLRPSNTLVNLSGALTILHSIPIARETFLVREHCRSDYGQDDQWWNGHDIRILRIINVDEEESQVPEEFVEVQRLMAFLDQTNRAYGGIEGISVAQDIQEDDGQNGVAAPITSFLKGWVSAVARTIPEESEAEKYTKAFVSHATQRAREDQAKTDVVVEEKHQNFQVLELHAASSDDFTFYDALDKVIWLSDDGSEVFVEFADIICMTITPDYNDTPRRGCRLDIPPIFYPDRYTEVWTEPVRAIKEQIEEKRYLIDDLEVKEEKLKTFRPSTVGSVRNPPAFEPKLLLESILENLSIPELSTISSRSEDNSTESQKDVAMESQQDIAMESQLAIGLESENDISGISHILKSILSQLEKKLNDLSLRKDEARETYKKLKSAYTSPETSDPAMPPLTKYSLRGVCTDPTTTFVLIPTSQLQEAPINGASSSSSSLPNEQWWCLQWGPPKSSNSGWDDTPTASYEVKKVAEEEVMEAVKTTGDGSLVAIYANENAMNPKNGIDMSLPGPLQTFVDKDNAAFKLELQPTSPGGKRGSEWLEADDEAVDMNSFSPKKVSSSSRSSATLGNVTPQHSRRNSIDGTEMEMTEGVDPENGVGVVGMSRVVGPTIELPPPHQGEMAEKSHISPIAKAFHLDFKGRDIDQDMGDAEHIEYSTTVPDYGEGRRL